MNKKRLSALLLSSAIAVTTVFSAPFTASALTSGTPEFVSFPSIMYSDATAPATDDYKITNLKIEVPYTLTATEILAYDLAAFPNPVAATTPTQSYLQISTSTATNFPTSPVYNTLDGTHTGTLPTSDYIEVPLFDGTPGDNILEAEIDLSIPVGAPTPNIYLNACVVSFDAAATPKYAFSPVTVTSVPGTAFTTLSTVTAVDNLATNSIDLTATVSQPGTGNVTGKGFYYTVGTALGAVPGTPINANTGMPNTGASAPINLPVTGAIANNTFTTNFSSPAPGMQYKFVPYVTYDLLVNGAAAPPMTITAYGDEIDHTYAGGISYNTTVDYVLLGTNGLPVAPQPPGFGRVTTINKPFGSAPFTVTTNWTPPVGPYVLVGSSLDGAPMTPATTVSITNPNAGHAVEFYYEVTSKAHIEIIAKDSAVPTGDIVGRFNYTDATHTDGKWDIAPPSTVTVPTPAMTSFGPNFGTYWKNPQFLMVEDPSGAPMNLTSPTITLNTAGTYRVYFTYESIKSKVTFKGYVGSPAHPTTVPVPDFIAMSPVDVRMDVPYVVPALNAQTLDPLLWGYSGSDPAVGSVINVTASGITVVYYFDNLTGLPLSPGTGGGSSSSSGSGGNGGSGGSGGSSSTTTTTTTTTSTSSDDDDELDIDDLNIDIDGDGIPDLNIDTDGDGIPDVNIDTNGDGIPDKNIDTDGDGDADVSSVGGIVPNVATGSAAVVGGLSLLTIAAGAIIITKKRKK